MTDPTHLILEERKRDQRQLDEHYSTPTQLPISPLITPIPTTNLSDNSNNTSPLQNQQRDYFMNLRMQDYDHQRRFERFLNFRGVKRRQYKYSRVNSSIAETRNNDNLQRRNNRFIDDDTVSLDENIDIDGAGESELDHYDDDDDSNNDGEFDPRLGDIPLIDVGQDYDSDNELITDPENPLEEFLTRENPETDADLYYLENSLAFPTNTSNVDIDSRSSSRNNNNTGTGNLFVTDDSSNTIYLVEREASYGGSVSSEYPCKDDKSHCVPTNANDTFANFENHLNKEPVLLIEDFQMSNNVEFAVKNQPASKFQDPLKMDYINFKKLKLELGRKYKSNTCVVSEKYNMLIVGTTSTLQFFDIGGLFSSNEWTSTIEFDTKPSTTTNEHLNNATVPYFPHTINYMKIGQFKNQDTLVVAVDDGRILVYYMDSLMQEVQRFKIAHPKSNGRVIGQYEFKTSPIYTLMAWSSVWGIDIYDNMITSSDNCQMIKLFYFDDHGLKTAQTHQVLHNIPSISFIPTEDKDNFFISAGSISGELLIFKFPAVRSTEDPARVLSFKKPVVISRAVFTDNVWTTQYVDTKFFKAVNSLQALTGDPWLENQDTICDKILSESKMLDTESDECISSNLGLASWFQHYFIPTVSFSYPKSQSSNTRFTSITDTYRRFKKAFDDYYLTIQRGKFKQHKSMNGKSYWEKAIGGEGILFHDKFLLITTALRSGLFRANKLICNATVPNVFRYKPLNEELSYSNRMSLSLVIPELSCYIVASQIGIVSVFRMTQFRGVHGLRQEYVLPNYNRLCLSGDSRMRTMIGLSCKKLDDGRYLLFLCYIDGLVLIYRIYEDLDLGLLRD